MKARTVGNPGADRPTTGFGQRGTTDIEQLKGRFAAFRAGHRSRTRIPDALREAVLGALADGVDPAELRRACGVSSAQVDQWQRSRRSPRVTEEGCQPLARVFSVEEEPGTTPLAAGGGAPPTLELRVAGWSVAIRPVVAAQEEGCLP